MALVMILLDGQHISSYQSSMEVLIETELKNIS